MHHSHAGRDHARRVGGPGSGRNGHRLTIAQEIPLQHGGELHVSSEPGRGSAFAVVIPRGR